MVGVGNFSHESSRNLIALSMTAALLASCGSASHETSHETAAQKTIVEPSPLAFGSSGQQVAEFQ